MNNFDDRVSYFVWLRENGRLFDCLDNNKQQDNSLLTYGGMPAKYVIMQSDFQVNI